MAPAHAPSARARQVVWAPAPAAEPQEGAPANGGYGGGADGAPAAPEGTGHGSIFVVMAGLVKSSFSTSGGGSQARLRAPGGSQACGCLARHAEGCL